MKIGIDSRAAKWYRGTGIGTYTYQLISSLNKIDRLNDYLLFTPEGYTSDIEFNNNFKNKSIPDSLASNFWDDVNIPNVLYDGNINLYHVPQNGVGLPLDKSMPFVITLHDTIPIHMPETVGERYLDIFTREMRGIVNRSDGIITVSEYSKEDIARDFNYPKDKIFVTYLASEDIYKPLDKVLCTDILKKYYGLPSNYILYVGGFSPRKNIVGLIEAFSRISHKLPEDINLVIAGSKGKSYAIYKECAERLKIDHRVIFPGFISMDHMPHLYNNAALFVYPSFYEGFGLPPIEAMACGIPVIASNVTSIPEIVEDAALLFNPKETEILSEKIYEVLSNETLRNSLISKGFKKASSLSWENTAVETLKAYGAILK
jgi:glycosyltransferase involved in cell wall biosynthesis